MNAPATAATIRRVWLVANPSSGSTGPTTRDAVVAAIERHAALAGATSFPAEPLPTTADLDAAAVDTLAVLAGDGTINAAACRYADWNGALLILPGGTMNLLAKALHGSTDAPAIVVQAAAGGATRTALPLVEAEGHCAFVGLILGPATSWNSARELLRAGRWRGLARAVRLAWQRTLGHRVRLDGLDRGAQAVFVRAEDDALVASAIDAPDWRSIVELGWEWLTGDWVAARAVTQVRRRSLRVRGRRPVHALFDGERRVLAPAAEIRLARSRPIFLRTRAGE